jgi:endogenous inhibitor of DNA gyrase (YacG/DUF329 family)
MPTFNCPTCGKPIEWTPASKWRPFCSERCRLIDLGAWLSEQRSIPGEDAVDDPHSLPSAGGQPPNDEPPRH